MAIVTVEDEFKQFIPVLIVTRAVSSTAELLVTQCQRVTDRRTDRHRSRN